MNRDENEAKRATFTVAWADPTLKFTADRGTKSNLIAIRLRDPKGKLLHPNAAHVRRTVGEGFVAFDIVEPLAGKWYVEVSTAIERHTRYTVGGFVDSPVRMHLALGPKQERPSACAMRQAWTWMPTSGNASSL